MKQTLLVVMVGALLTGCATMQVSAPLQVSDVVAMAQAGRSDAEIIQEIDRTRSVFRLTADDLTLLRNSGVSDPVITHMLDTYTQTLLKEERAGLDRFKYDYGYGYPYSVLYDEYRVRW